MTDTRLVREISVLQRYRKDLGDLDGLMENMSTIGLLQPIVITPDNRLIAGALSQEH